MIWLIWRLWRSRYDAKIMKFRSDQLMRQRAINTGEEKLDPGEKLITDSLWSRVAGLTQHHWPWIKFVQGSVALAPTRDCQLAKKISQVLTNSQTERAKKCHEFDKVQMGLVDDWHSFRFRIPWHVGAPGPTRTILILLSWAKQTEKCKKNSIWKSSFIGPTTYWLELLIFQSEIYIIHFFVLLKYVKVQ